MLQTTIAKLRAAGCVFAEEEAELMISEAKSETELTSMVQKRTNGTPLEQILGWAEFCGNRIVVEPEVFIPRFKTEFLVRQALALCNPDSTVLDLCCGTGALGFAMKTSNPSMQLFASDVDPVAAHCARRNLEAFGVPVFEGDLFEALPKGLMGKINVLVANAPYVPTDSIELMPRESRLFETKVSVDGGEDGLAIHRRIASSAFQWLAPGGSLLIEIAEGQAKVASGFFEGNGLEARIIHSEEFEASVLIGKRL